MSAHGLNNFFHGANMKYKVSGSNQCVPSSVNFDNEDDFGYWWGNTLPSDQDTLPTLDNIPTIVGNMHPFRRYYVQNYLAEKDVSPFPELMQKIHIYNLENSMNNPTVEWVYKPQVNILFPTSPSLAFVDDDTTLGFGCKPLGFRGYKLGVDQTDLNHVSLTTEVASSVGWYDPEYYSYIEHSGSMAHGFAEYGGGFQPPTLHVGCLPVHSYSTTPTDDDIQDITVIYKVDTYCEIEYSYDFIYPYTKHGNAHSLNTGDHTFVKQNPRMVSAYGYKAVISTASASSVVTASTTTSRP